MFGLYLVHLAELGSRDLEIEWKSLPPTELIKGLPASELVYYIRAKL